MIGKQVKGRSFPGVLHYLHVKTGAECIGGNMEGKTPRQLGAEFQQSVRLNPSLKKPVYHASLSVPKDYPQNNERWGAIAQDYITGMGFGHCQYVVYRHHDREHDHIHIVASRIQITDGKTVSDSWDYRRSERLVRSLEATYHLQPVQPSWHKAERRPTTGEVRSLHRTGQVSVRQKLQGILNAVIVPQMAMPEFIAAVQQQGVTVQLSTRKSTGVTGISYKLDGVAFSGTHLGRDFTFPGLQKHRQIDYGPSRDDASIASLLMLSERSGAAIRSDGPASASASASVSVAVDQLQQQAAAAIIPIAIALFQAAYQQGAVAQTGLEIWALQGKQYGITYDHPNGVFSLHVQDGRGELLRFCRRDGFERLEVAQGIEKRDLIHFQQIQQVLQVEKREQGRSPFVL